VQTRTFSDAGVITFRQTAIGLRCP
jgi:hypothetical protein